MTTKAQFDKVSATLSQARADGLDCIAGGERLEREGNFPAPTIYRDVLSEHPI